MAKLSYGVGCDGLMGDHGSWVKVALLPLQKKAAGVRLPSFSWGRQWLNRNGVQNSPDFSRLR